MTIQSFGRIGRKLLAGGLLVAGLGAASLAQARSDVYFSLGVNAPGVSTVISNVPVYHGAPVYYGQPVVVAPRYYHYGPPKVVYGPPAYGYYHKPYRHWGHKHGYRHHDGHGPYRGQHRGYSQGHHGYR